MKDKAEFYQYLWERNNGTFYRGTSGDKGLGFGVLGQGLYFTWDRGMAVAFAMLSHKKHGGVQKLITYKLSKNLKLLDAQSKTMGDIKKSFGVQPWANIDDPTFARILTFKIQELGFDGVISDKKQEGILVFNNKKSMIRRVSTHTLSK